jgi:hypothetical protein
METKKIIIRFSLFLMLLFLGCYFGWAAFHSSLFDAVGYVYTVIGTVLAILSFAVLLHQGKEALLFA